MFNAYIDHCKAPLLADGPERIGWPLACGRGRRPIENAGNLTQAKPEENSHAILRTSGPNSNPPTHHHNGSWIALSKLRSIAFASSLLLDGLLRQRQLHGHNAVAVTRANAIMIPAKRARGALRCLQQAQCQRNFSATAGVAAVSPYTNARQSATTNSPKAASKRDQSTAATATATQTKSAERPVPSPAFNRDDNRLRNVQPLRPYKPQPEMDHSLVGMTGGEIFHEMMLRHDVKHVCK